MRKGVLLFVIIISLFLASGCIEEEFQQAKRRAIELAKTNQEFTDLLYRHPNAKTNGVAR